MKPSLKSACCAACRVNENGPKAAIVERAAGWANDFYDANPMPCGSASVVKRYHKQCAAHVGQQVRVGCGVLTFLSLFSMILSICYTTWSWRHTLDREAEQKKDQERQNHKLDMEIEQLERSIEEQRRSH
jgi:hypothetical protein